MQNLCFITCLFMCSARNKLVNESVYFSQVLWELLTHEIPFEGLNSYRIMWLVVEDGQVNIEYVLNVVLWWLTAKSRTYFKCCALKRVTLVLKCFLLTNTFVEDCHSILWTLTLLIFFKFEIVQIIFFIPCSYSSF